MKLSRQHTKTYPAPLEAVMRFVDDEISKIVAEIGANRPPQSAAKPRTPRKAVAAHATA